MAIIRTPTDLDNPINYVATVAFFCCVSCAVFMLKFGGFKASLNLLSRNKNELELEPTESITGAYRINRDEFFGNGSISDPPKKLTPSMVKLPPSTGPALRPTKSTSDLVTQANLPPPPPVTTHRSTQNVSLDPRGGPSASAPNNNRASAPLTAKEKKQIDAQTKLEEKEQKKLEKQRLAEEKARAKAQAKERAKQEKIRREQEKKAAQEQARLIKQNKKMMPKPAQGQRANAQAPRANAQAPAAIPAPPQAPASNPVPPQRGIPKLNQAPAPPPPPALSQYSTNTLESSISRSSGPPPYAEATPAANQPAGNSNTSNVSFGKKIDQPSSWDMVSQHREQMSRPVASSLHKTSNKNMVMDLQYKLGTRDDKENSDA